MDKLSRSVLRSILRWRRAAPGRETAALGLDLTALLESEHQGGDFDSSFEEHE